MNSTNPSEAFVADPVRKERLASRQKDDSIGAILIRSGRLSALDADKVIQFSQSSNLRFGDAAVEMGLLTAADIELALSHHYLLPGESAISAQVVAAYEPFTARVESLRALRNQLMWRWFDTGAERRALAITSAESGDGRSFLAANLAVVFSQQRQRTLLIDANLRAPHQHTLFALENRDGLSAMLAGRSGRDAIQRVPALADLSVLTAGALPPNPSELLGLPSFGRLLRELATDYDVILIDTPSGEMYSDAQVIASRAGAAVIVAHQDQSQLKKMRELVALLGDARVHLVGTVLNEY
jgi:protein-tyrosine kinase